LYSQPTFFQHKISALEYNTIKGSLTENEIAGFEFQAIQIHWCERPNASVDVLNILKCGNSNQIFVAGIQAKFVCENITEATLYAEACKFCPVLEQIQKLAKDHRLTVKPCFLLVQENVQMVKNLDRHYSSYKNLTTSPNPKAVDFPVIILKSDADLKALLGV